MKNFYASFSSSRIAAAMKTALLFVLLLSALRSNAQITVTATAGTLGPTVYGTLNGAIGAINSGTHQGDVLLTVTASTVETIQSTLNQSGLGAANYTTVTIRPGTGATPTITGSIATGILLIYGSNVTIDGSNTVGGTTRDLTISNTSGTIANSYVVRIGSPSTALGAVNSLIRNTNIISSNPTNLGLGIVVGSGGATVTNNAESPNNKTTIRNCSITGAEYAIFYQGNVAIPDNQVEISNNNITSPVCGTWLTFSQNSNIYGNTVTGTPIAANFAVNGIFINGTMVNTNIYNNRISAIRNTSTGAAAAAYGIELYAFNGPVNVYNNFVYDVASYGNATAASNGIGIYAEQGSGYYIYHNSVNLTTGQTVAAGSPSAFMVGTGVTAPGAVALMNNIFANNQTTGSTQRYAIYNNSATGASVFSAIDYNDYYTATGPNLGFQAGSGALLNLTAVRTAMGSNTHSLNVSPPFVSTTDPHINIVACAGTPLESGGASLGIFSDIDAQVRPGPTPSSCGGGTAPDIGADEFDGGVNDGTPPAITYTPAPNICTPADVTLTASITDATGVPTTGAFMPRIYFQKNAGPWFSAAGTLTAGTTISGTWSFTIPMATMGGLALSDVVNYYVIAQDNFSNITANPATGLVATDVNTVTTPPTTPNNYTVGMSLSGTYTVGAAGTFTTLTAAINAYNTACLLGPVVFLLTDPSYPSETFPITVRYNSYASSVNTLTIKPAGTTNISGAMPGNGLFYFYGARYVTIDGSNSGTTSQDLTWQNFGAAANSYVIRFGTPSLSVSNINNTVKNCIVTNGSASASTFGILSGSGSATFSNPAECVNKNNTLQNNTVSNSIYGYYLKGFSSTADSNWNINNNTTAGGAVSMAVYYMQNSNINNNTMSTSTSLFVTEIGLQLNGAFYNINIYDNKVSGITNTGAFGAYGMYLLANSSSSGINIFNNFISNVSTGGGALANNGFGIYAIFGTGYNIVENSINMGTNQTSGISAAICINGITLPGSINIVDNILANNQTAGVPVASRYCLYSANPNTIFGTINYNDYYTATGTNLGFIGVNRANLAAMQTGFGGNLNSINSAPTFNTATDLHLQLLASNLPLNAGLFTGGITTDIDGDTRISPTMGADELILCPTPITGSPTTICVGGTTNLTDAIAGGVWTSTPGTGSASVSSTGLVTGLTAGTATISYTIAGCSVTQDVTVNAAPSAGTITGTLTVCPAGVTALSDATGAPGGTWSSTVPAVGTVDASGNVTGLTAGTTTISYTVTSSCGAVATTVVVTVNPSPSAGIITGLLTVCATSTINLTDAATGGVWSSVSTGVATVSATGVVTGIAAGTSTISYAVTNSCGTAAATVVVTVNPLPVAGTITGSLNICPATTTTLSDATASPVGVWSSVSTGVATVSATGVVTGLTSGTSTISYTVTNSCGTVAATAVVTVNPSPSAGIITGLLTVCATSTINLTDAATGGVWSSVSTGVATVSATGVVTGMASGTSTISYTVTNSCGTAAATVVVTVFPMPVAGTITGSLNICPATTTALSNATGGAGVWSSVSTGVATVSATGVVTGLTNGTSTISYTVTNSCGSAAATVVVTVSASPNAGSITGTLTVCAGSATNLTDAAGGGAWTSVSTGVATVSATGVVNGLTAGTTTISYTVTNSCGTAAATAIVTVNPLPVAGTITGLLTLCPTTTTTLSNATGGAGVWSSVSTGVATVSATGVVTGLTNGTSTISYTVTNSCGTVAATTVVTVNPSPSAGSISGTLVICPTVTTALTDGAGGGVWSSVSTGVATVSATGVVTGISNGTSTISYTVTNSCGTAAATAVVTVNASPVAGSISGTLVLCPTTSSTLTDAVGGGVWSSLSTGVATITATGVVTGVANGTSTISYTVTNSCGTAAATAVVTVNPSPNAGTITGTFTVCPTVTTALTDAAPSGAWSSGATGIATVSASGVLTGVSGGTATISYAVGNSCGTAYATAVVTVNPAPNAGSISGTLSVCPLSTTALSDAAGGGAGTWSSSATGTASVSATGVVAGISPGTAIISYAVTNICGTAYATATVTVNTPPNAGAIVGTLTVCPTVTTALSDPTGNPGGVWSSVATGVATVSATGVVTGISAGTSTISYTVTNGCGTAATTAVVTVSALPTAGSITGTYSVCPGTTTALSDATAGGVWSSGAPALASVDAVGVVTGHTPGTATISYGVTNSCATAYATAVVTINPSPYAGTIFGALLICQTNTTTLTESIAGGAWSSGAPGVASITASGLMTGVSLGTATISYGVTNVCGTAYATAIASVNPLPIAGAIVGSSLVCPGTSVTLSDPAAGGSGAGIWSTSPTTIATADSSTGVVTGVATGTATVTFTVSNACGSAFTTTTVTVHPFPTAIHGLDAICQANAMTLSDSVSDGAWSSSDATIAIVTPAVGTFPTSVVSGLTAGTVDISYVVAPGCFVTHTVTVNLLGTISTVTNMCVGSTHVATDLPAGGTWISSNPAVATIDTFSGSVAAIAPGATIISYSLGAGCVIGKEVTVNMVPANYYMTGGGTYCTGGPGVHVGLDGSDTGITYHLIIGSSVIGSMTGTGAAIDFGLQTTPGVYTVIAENNTTGCTHAMGGSDTVTISSAVSPSVNIAVSPGTTICAGSPATFTALTATGGTAPIYSWSVNGTVVSGASTYGYLPNNGDIVSVKLTSNAACVFPDTAVAFVVMTTSTVLSTAVSIVASPGDSVCPGTPVTLTPVPVFGGPTPAYTWIKNGIYQGAGSTYTFFPIGGDNVYCWMYSSLSCALTDSVPSNNIVMEVPAINIPAVAINAYPDYRVAYGDTVTLVAGVGFTGISLSYQWEINGFPVPGATNDTFVSTFENQDSVSCLVTGYSACGSTTREAHITILDTVALGIHELKGVSDMKLMPNPNTGSFTLKGSAGTDKDLFVTVTNMLGQVIYERKIATQKGKVNERIELSNTLANGMYLLNARSGDENKVFHFVVER